MQTLKLDLEHCYGIRQLKFDFQFQDGNTWAIYAANGVMKSSLAKMFGDVAKGVDSSDKIFPDRVTGMCQ